MCTSASTGRSRSPAARASSATSSVAAAKLVAGYGGSLSGEHGDGRARSELLPLMYSPEALNLFAAVKHTFDPDNVLNPGVLVDPRPLDADLRVPAAPLVRRDLALAYHHDGGNFTQAVHRCTGVGKCRADNTASGGVMCPSYQATREEKDSTRGRARVLQEMINGTAVTGGWRSPEVHEALDLCLSCKGCASDCPTGVDMAAFKSEVLHQSYRRRLRPPSHYSLGWLPRWARIASKAPGLVNSTMRIPGVGPFALSGAGVDKRRTIPPFARQTFRSWFSATAADRAQTGDPVLLFVDSFTNYFTPEVGHATVRVLEAAGYRPQLTEKPQCCGLTWISTGQLTGAKKILGRTVAALSESGDVPIVGMEPSCTGVLRSDATELLGATADPVAQRTRTLAELLTERGWEPPPLDGGVGCCATALPPPRGDGLECRRETTRIRRGRCAAARRMLRPRRQFRCREGALRGVRRRRRTATAARGCERRPGDDDPCRRLLVPNATLRSHRSAGEAPGAVVRGAAVTAPAPPRRTGSTKPCDCADAHHAPSAHTDRATRRRAT